MTWENRFRVWAGFGLALCLTCTLLISELLYYCDPSTLGLPESMIHLLLTLFLVCSTIVYSLVWYGGVWIGLSRCLWLAQDESQKSAFLYLLVPALLIVGARVIDKFSQQQIFFVPLLIITAIYFAFCALSAFFLTLSGNFSLVTKGFFPFFLSLELIVAGFLYASEIQTLFLYPLYGTRVLLKGEAAAAAVPVLVRGVEYDVPLDVMTLYDGRGDLRRCEKNGRIPQQNRCLQIHSLVGSYVISIEERNNCVP